MAITRGDEIIEAGQAALAALRALTFGPYERKDIATILEPFGWRIELFLRAVALPTSSKADKFYHLVEMLAGQGVDAHADDRVRLRDLRGLREGGAGFPGHEPRDQLELGGALLRLPGQGDPDPIIPIRRGDPELRVDLIPDLRDQALSPFQIG